MNKRIEQLAKQAGFSTELAEAMAARHNTTSGLEKFAELIVKECMAVAAKQRKPANLNYNPGERFAEDLRQHFGVEE